MHKAMLAAALLVLSPIVASPADDYSIQIKSTTDGMIEDQSDAAFSIE